MLNRFFENLFNSINNCISQFNVDTIVITDEHIDYFNNYYLKGIKHDKFTTNK